MPSSSPTLPFDEPPDEPGRLIPGSSPARPAASTKEEREQPKQEQKAAPPSPSSPERALRDALRGTPVQQTQQQPPQKQPRGPNVPADDAWRTLLRKSQKQTTAGGGGGGSGPGTPAASPARPAASAARKSSAGTASPGATASPSARTPPRTSTVASSAASASSRPAPSPSRPSRRSSAGSASVGSAGSTNTPVGSPVGTPASEARRARREHRRAGGGAAAANASGGGAGATSGGGAVVGDNHTGTALDGKDATPDNSASFPTSAPVHAPGTIRASTAANAIPAIPTSTDAASSSSPTVSPFPTPRRIAGVGGQAIADPDSSLLKKRLEAEAEARARTKSRSRSRGRDRGGGGGDEGSGGDEIDGGGDRGEGGSSGTGMTTPVGTPRRGRGPAVGGAGDELDELVQRSDERRSRSAGTTPASTPKGGRNSKAKTKGTMVADFSPSSVSSSSSSGKRLGGAAAQRRMADEMAELDALVQEADSPDRRGGGGGTRNEAAYDTRSIHDVPPSPPTPSSSDGHAAGDSKVQEDVGTLAQMLEEVNMDDIHADPDIDLLPSGHDDDDDNDDDKEGDDGGGDGGKDEDDATWQPFATGAFASPDTGAVEAATATIGASDTKPRGTIDPEEEEEEEDDDNTAGRRTQMDPPEQGDDVMSVAMFSVDGGDEANLFHSDPFAGNSGAVPEATAPIISQDDAFAAFDPVDEKKGQDAPADEADLQPMPSDELLGIKRMRQKGTTGSREPDEEDDDSEPYREDDAELGARLLTTSTSNDDDVGAEAGEESQADRIKRYNRRADGNSSSDDEDESSDDDDGEEQQEAQFQAMDDNVGSDDDDNAGGHLGVRFEPSVLSSEHHPLPSRTLSADDDGASSIVASSVPPPPPPRRAADQLVNNLLAGKQFRTDSSADTEANQSIPLIKPPPPEKMKAWASSKGLIPSNDDQPAPSTDRQLNLPAMEAAERALAEAKRQLGEPVEEKPKEENVVQFDPFPVVSGIEAESVAQDAVVDDDDKSSTNIDSADPTTDSEDVDAESIENDEANEEQIRSHVPVTTKVPVEKETAEDRARLAAKFASASSAAAQVFEKKYESSPRGSSEGRTRVAHASVPPMDDGTGKNDEGNAPNKSSSYLFCGSDENYACGGEPDGSRKNLELRPPGAFEVSDLDPKTSSQDEAQRGVDLHGGAFNSWVKDYDSPTKGAKDDVSSIGIAEDDVKAAEHAAASAINRSKPSFDATSDAISPLSCLLESPSNATLLTWVKDVVVGNGESSSASKDIGEEEAAQELQVLLASRMVFNKICQLSTQTINDSCANKDDKIAGYEIIDGGSQQAQIVVFVNFLERVAYATNSSVPSPFDKGALVIAIPPDYEGKSLQDLIFHEEGTERTVRIVSFLYQACRISEEKKLRPASPETPRKSLDAEAETFPDDTVKRRNARGSPVKSALKPSSLAPTALFGGKQNKNLIVPKRYPSPFETSVWNSPSIVPKFLSFLGDPAAVCRMKAVNRDCQRIISDNEHVIMKTAVRLGGLEMHLRPSFWMWITLEKCRPQPNPNAANDVEADAQNLDLEALSRAGEEGRWHHTIMRDVTRSFGNMPPHKSGQKLRKDSIVRALVFYGQGRLIKRGVKGGVDNYQRDIANIRQGPSSSRPGRENEGGEDDSITSDQSPTDTVSDWGAVSPVGSTVSIGKVDGDVSLLNDSKISASGVAGPSPIKQNPSMQSSAASVEVEDIALCPRDLTNEVKEDLQNKLGFILHALAASNDKVGYCQGMDYIVAHLLRILQETVLYRAVKGTLPPIIKSKLRKSRSSSPSPSQSSSRSPRPPSPAAAQGIVSALDIDESSLVVEETVYRVMHTMLTTYGLQHFYWPELRCLKTCCKVFERLIEIKLPVLADHFDHHGLNVGIFALGWFQTLFLYLPSMPTATVCHMWDIWLVERSFKIFFRVGTAILFLSQPILLNHELEGMMTYLNTMPDATLLNPDILLACANQIKVTNKMLEEIEAQVTGQMAASASAKVDIAEKEAERQSTCSPFRY